MGTTKIDKNLLEQLTTPCFILDVKELHRSVEGFQSALGSQFQNYAVGYSVKTNPLPYCLGVVRRLGCFAEVVSSDEYHVARQCGFLPSNIVYNGPMKDKQTFIEAIEGGAIVNMEARRELDWLRELDRDKTYKVGLRLNINISKVSPEDADGENDNSRFGFSDETGEFWEACQIVNSLKNIRLSGLHIHRTAHSRSISFYGNSIRYACEVIRRYGLSLDYIDIGGGYFGIFPDRPTYADYASAFKSALSEYGLEQLRVVVEPGNALVASCFHFLSEVIDVKHVEENKWFLTTDGSRNDIDPFFRKSSYMTEIISNSTGDVVQEQVVSGCTCLEYDRLFVISQSPLLQVGDRILYKNVGAYTMCLTPLFIRFLPNIYAVIEHETRLIREKWGVKEFVQKSIIE